tara:strand:- start:2209 stop:2421 length:213 start_codon:yes stop_codon:yes gene_type:complete
LTGVVIIAIYNILINHRRNKMENTSKIKSFKIYTDDTNDGVEEKVLVGNDIDTALEILENNGYIIEVEYK